MRSVIRCWDYTGKGLNGLERGASFVEMRQCCGCWTRSGEASHQCLASEAGGIKGERLLKAEELQIEAGGVADDPPAGPQVDAESGKTDRKVRPEPRLKGGPRSGWVCRGFEASDDFKMVADSGGRG